MEKLQIEQILTLHKENKMTLEKATEGILLLLSVSQRSELLAAFHDWMAESDDYDVNWPAELKVMAFLSR